MKSRILAAVLVACAAVFAGWAQNPPAPTAPAARGGFGGAAVRSPEVAQDGRVTFRLRAPNAKEVFVSGMGQRLAMQKDERGIWTATTEPMKPDLYTYSFQVDGANFNDPSNNRFKTSFGSAGQSQVLVPGPNTWTPDPKAAKGALTRHFYNSPIVNDDRDFWVYTPAGYDPKRRESYPVFFLLHGLGDDFNSWIETGAANVILDNLIAQGKAKPMVMVNTLGYGNSGGPSGAMQEGMLAAYARTVMEEVLPMVEKAYNVSKDRNQRAIAGLSMGGAEATFTGLQNLDKFAWIGSYSGAYVMWPGTRAEARAGAPAAPAAAAPTPPPAPAAATPPAGGRSGRGVQSLAAGSIDKVFPKLTAAANSQIKLLWVAYGTADSLIGVNRQFKEWLDTKKVKLTYIETPDVGHVWPLWRQYLTDFTPLLFR